MTHLLLAVVMLFHHAPKPKYDGAWHCPAGYQVYGDEREALKGKDCAHCVKG